MDAFDAHLGPEARTVARESIELSFVVALQRLTARQRAVLRPPSGCPDPPQAASECAA